MKRTALAIVLLAGVSLSARADFDAGIAAYERGDYITAYREFRPLAIQGVGSAQYNLGLMYRDGAGVVKDYVEAVTWFRRAADQGIAEAQNKLGDMYNNGKGVPQNYPEAVNWYRKAAERGVASAQFNLAVKHFRGEGVPQDYVLAHMWSNLAASSTTGKTAETYMALRARINEKMTTEDISEAQRLAREWRPKR
ncbi:MAG: tetratricopeptide repeat protein [Alphaproteobacteria bacterium]